MINKKIHALIWLVLVLPQLSWAASVVLMRMPDPSGAQRPVNISHSNQRQVSLAAGMFVELPVCTEGLRLNLRDSAQKSNPTARDIAPDAQTRFYLVRVLSVGVRIDEATSASALRTLQGLSKVEQPTADFCKAPPAVVAKRPNTVARTLRTPVLKTPARPSLSSARRPETVRWGVAATRRAASAARPTQTKRPSSVAVPMFSNQPITGAN